MRTLRATMHADNRLNDNNRSIRGSDIRGLGPTLGTLVIIIGKISIIHDCLPIIARFIRGVSETRGRFDGIPLLIK